MKTYQIVTQINPYIFRGYDIRGVMDKDLNKDVYYTFGRAFATFLKERQISLCPVGRDNRLNNESYSQAFIQGLNEGGVDTVDIGLSLSQIVYFASYVLKTKAGAMITASHNAKEFNGLKLNIDYSQTMVTQEVQQLKNIINNGKFTKGRGQNVEKDIFPNYKEDLLPRFKFKKKWRVVVDGCNSTAGLFYPKIFHAAGGEVFEQNTQLDGNFPLGVPDPTDQEVLKRLAGGVLQHQADLGLAYDADGDRMAVVDEKGQTLWMDTLVAIFAKDVLKQNPGASIVVNTYCSRQALETITKNDGRPVMWLVGHSFIKEKIKETGAPFGGELSGHLFFAKDFYSHDDAAYAGLRLLQILEEENKPLSYLVSQLPSYIGSPEIKVGVADDIKESFVKKEIYQELKKIWPKAQYSLNDGVRLDTLQEMVAIRASQNGPYLGMKFEAKTKEQYENVKRQLKKILTKYPQVDWKAGVNTEALD